MKLALMILLLLESQTRSKKIPGKEVVPASPFTLLSSAPDLKPRERRSVQPCHPLTGRPKTLTVLSNPFTSLSLSLSLSSPLPLPFSPLHLPKTLEKNPKLPQSAMTKVYGTGTYDFKRHRVAEYPVDVAAHIAADKPPDSFPLSNAPNTITLTEIQRDRLTKIAAANWLKSSDQPKKPFSPELVKEIYETELLVKGGRKPVPLQRVMILEVSQYLENYLWPNFDPETASFEHVMSMILMINEKVWFSWFKWIVFSFTVLGNLLESE